MNYLNLNFDLDGDGVNDSYAEELDTNDDERADIRLVDSDKDGAPDVVYSDTNADGYYDVIEEDVDKDGYVDVEVRDEDYDGTYETLIQFEESESEQADSADESNVTNYDRNGDGIADVVLQDMDGDEKVDNSYFDTDGDGIMDAVVYMVDRDGNGKEDAVSVAHFSDTDGDGDFDEISATLYDENDRVVSENTMEIDRTDLVELNPILVDDADNGTWYTNLENFEPNTADITKIVGNPAESMQEWECQGETNRCALYAQKFVIEEFTGQEIDIEEMADFAEARGWFNEANGTNHEHLTKMLDYFGIENEESFNNDLTDIADCLNDGGRIIVTVDSGEIWCGENDVYSPQTTADHAVEVVGIDYSNPENPMVILNDSGIENGCGVKVPADTFLDAWADGGNYMITCTND